MTWRVVAVLSAGLPGGSPVGTPPDGAPESILSNLPDGSGPITAIVVAVCGVLAVAIPVLGRLLPDRSGARHDGSSGGSGSAASQADIAELQRSIERIEKLEKELRATQDDVKQAQSRYEAEKEHSHDLEMRLAAAQARLERAGDELAEVRTQLAMVLRPLHQEPPPGPWSRPPSLVPRPYVPAPPPHAPGLAADDAPTDPIREARRP